MKFQRNRNISYHVVLFLNIRDIFQICSLLETLKSNISFFLLRKIDSIIKKKISLCKNYKDTFLREFCPDSRNYFTSSIRDSISSFILESKLDESVA